jgi:hypothetical protein
MMVQRPYYLIWWAYPPAYLVTCTVRRRRRRSLLQLRVVLVAAGRRRPAQLPDPGMPSAITSECSYGRRRAGLAGHVAAATHRGNPKGCHYQGAADGGVLQLALVHPADVLTVLTAYTPLTPPPCVRHHHRLLCPAPAALAASASTTDSCLHLL